MKLSDERDFVEFISRALGSESAALIGDDTATVSLPAGQYCLTVDSQVAGVHFLPEIDASTVARRLLAVNLSDLAAAGATPRLALLALAAPSNFDHRSFFESLGRSAEEAGVTVCGGDLTAAEKLSASLTLFGVHPPGTSPLRRDRAQVGDFLWVGGSLGESALGRHLLAAGGRWNHGVIDLTSLGLSDCDQPPAEQAIRRHLEPRPQLELGGWLATLPRAAGLDISDGLALDLHRLTDASRVGVEIDSRLLPIPPKMQALSTGFGHDPLDLALFGGEDYVLLFALPPDLEPPAKFAASRIGSVTGGREVTCTNRDGHSTPLPPGGWDHLGFQP